MELARLERHIRLQLWLALTISRTRPILLLPPPLLDTRGCMLVFQLPLLLSTQRSPSSNPDLCRLSRRLTQRAYTTHQPSYPARNSEDHHSR